MDSRAQLNWLRHWDATLFLEEQRAGGRGALPPAQVERYADDHRRAVALTNGSLDAGDHQIAHLLAAITAPLAALAHDPVPRYYSYTAANVLDIFLDGEHLDLEARKLRCLEGIRGLVLDLGRFEAHSMLGIERWCGLRFDSEISYRRVKALRGQLSQWDSFKAIIHPPPLAIHEPKQQPSLKAYCAEVPMLSAMVQFTCIPRTLFHDEILFLRTIAQDELCFTGMYISVRQAIEAIERHLPQEAPLYLVQATHFARMLHASFRVLHTMPPDHFADFREATGDASAVQSFNYQRLDVYLFGVNPGKRDVYRRFDHLLGLLHYATPEFASLKAVLHRMDGPTDDAWLSILTEARKLDAQLLSWRLLHLKFAQDYLPAEASGTGGTSGASYLRRFVPNQLFSDTQPDLSVIEELFGEVGDVEQLFGVRPGIRVAPPERYWVTKLGSEEQP